MSSRTILRATMRARRNAMDRRTITAASIALCRRLHASQLYWGAQHIAIFRATGNEVDLGELNGAAWREGKRVYLPVMRPEGKLWFVNFRPQDRLFTNRHGIEEPPFHMRRWLPAKLIDLICVPLLAFDRSGNRLGAGGGYYDRSLANCDRSGATRPLLVGTAFACQEAPAIEARPWDVPLSWIVTEKEIIRCER